MHELAIMRDVLDLALEYGTMAGARKVTSIHLKVGAFTELVERWAQTYLDMISKDTIAEKARLQVTLVPGVITCRQCGRETEITEIKLKLTCSGCGSGEVVLKSGQEMRLESIEFE